MNEMRGGQMDGKAEASAMAVTNGKQSLKCKRYYIEFVPANMHFTNYL